MHGCRTDFPLRPVVRALAVAVLAVAGLMPAVPAAAQASGQPMPLLVVPAPDR